MTNQLPSQALADAANKLAVVMPSSTLPIGPQLEAWAQLVLAGYLANACVESNPAGTTFFIRNNQHKTLKAAASSWIVFKCFGDDYEIHNALPIHGLSGAHHEVDVCIVRGVQTPGGQVGHQDFVAGLECKQHKRQIDDNVVRILLGINVDAPPLCPWYYGTPPVRWRPWAVVSTHTATSANTTQLLDAYNIHFIGVDAAAVTAKHIGIRAFALKTVAHLMP